MALLCGLLLLLLLLLLRGCLWWRRCCCFCARSGLRVVVLGEDVSDASRTEPSAEDHK